MDDPGLCRPAASFLPATAVLEMTYRCNHACLFCSCPWFAEGNGFDVRPELTAAEWKDVILMLTRMGVTDLAFTGGEPLLKEGIEDLLAYAAGLTVEHVETVDGRLDGRRGPPKLHLLSNGKAMRQEILDLCKRHDIQLSMSLPGFTTLAEHTRGGETRHILEWFRRAHAAGLTTVVGVTVTRRNLPELYETLAEALLAGADSLLLNRFLPGGRGIRHAQELSLDREGILQMLDTAEEVLRTADRYGNVGTELPKCLFEGRTYERLKVGTRCSAGIDFFAVDPSGWVRACNHSPVRLHHVREIDKVKAHPYWKRFVMKDYLPKACGGCGLRLSCDGGCREAAHIVRGALDAVDPVLGGPF